MDYTAGYDAAAQPIHHHQAYYPAAQPVHQYQGFDPSAQPHQFYNQSSDDYYSYAYSNPQYATSNPYPYHGINAQHGEQEPNPPGVAVPHHDPNAYYHGYCAAPAYTVDAGVAAVNQPIVQPSYNTTGTMNGVALAYPGIAQNHHGPIQNFSAHSYRGRGQGRGRGRSLHKREEKRVISQVGPSQPIPQSYGPSLGPTPAQAQAQLAPSSKHLWCELCKVECNSLEILNRHNSGKKHMKKLKTFESGSQQLPRESSLPSQLPRDTNGVEKQKAEEGKGKALWCEMCKANCDTIEVFNKHLSGKKHQKKMKTSIQIGVQTDPEVQGSLPSQEINEESVETMSKRKMRGGKVMRSVRSKRAMESPQPKEVVPLLCELCNIKCKSHVVFQSHIVGKKHLLNAKRFLSENKVLGQEVFQILKHAVQTFQGASSNSFMGPQLDHRQQGLLLGKPMNFQALESNLESGRVEDTSQSQLASADFGGCPVMANGEGIPNEGQSGTGHLVSS